MDKKRYSKTRYQNIYKNIKNKNYIVSISTPKTTLSTIDGKKIYDINDAIKLRDDTRKKTLYNKTVKLGTFSDCWDKYINDCKNAQKMAYNTIKKKKTIYNTALNYFDKQKINKISKNDILLFLEKLDKSDKQKNEILKNLKAFFTWCCKNDYLLISPATYISKYKVPKPKITYWIPDEVNKFFSVLNDDIENNIDIIKAYTIKIFSLITFYLGDRTGETRVLTFNCINEKNKTLTISHSINYDTKNGNFRSDTKTINSQRVICVTDKFINEIKKWRDFLENNCKIKVNDDTPIILNLANNKPLSDTTLRKWFYEYTEKANVTKIKMYNLRHTFATTMMGEGWEDYAISKKMGHKKVSTTIDIYGNISEKIQREMAESMDKYY